MGNEDHFDLTVVGLGSVGLATALAAQQGGMRVAVIDPQDNGHLEGGTFDGRDVAISNASMRWLDSLGITQGLAEGERAPIRGAHMIDTLIDKQIDIGPAPGESSIGAFVPEYRLRQLAFRTLQQKSACQAFTENKVSSIEHQKDGIRVHLSDGNSLETRLLAAVDGRRSPLRSMLGIGVSQHGFALSMVCCRVHHEHDQQGWTSQRFVAGGCMAILPLSATMSSLALMMPTPEAEQAIALDDEAFTTWLEDKLGKALGSLSLASKRFSVPLSSHYADHMHGRHSVLLGDAAVGMLPITAHGLNLGLVGARSLVAELIAAKGRGEAFDSESVLKRYSLRAHATAKPLYLATNEICRLFLRNDHLSLQARRLLMQASGPLGQLIGMNCEQDNPRQVPWLGVLRDLPKALLSRHLAR